MVGEELSIVWHAGEPLVVPPSWYEEAFAVVARRVPEGTRVRHQMQTNAVLVDDRWCAFLREHGVQIGVSVDGPAFLHDARRKTRDGKGTHAKVVTGIAALREAGIPFSAIAVLTLASLAHADALYDFFTELGCGQVGFNVEEIEADNGRSSLEDPRAPSALRAFWTRMFERRAEAEVPLRIREIEHVLGALGSPVFGAVAGNSQNQAGRLLSVAFDGAFTTWSPELLGVSHPVHGPMALAPSLAGGLGERARQRLALFQEEIDRGVAACRSSCKYFDFCLGGAPANKLGEHGRFDGTETMFCRLTEKVLVEAVLAELDRRLPAVAPG